MWYNTAMSESGTTEKREMAGTLRGVSLRFLGYAFEMPERFRRNPYADAFEMEF